jgi:hypothetical protein
MNRFQKDQPSTVNPDEFIGDPLIDPGATVEQPSEPPTHTPARKTTYTFGPNWHIVASDDD